MKAATLIVLAALTISGCQDKPVVQSGSGVSGSGTPGIQFNADRSWNDLVKQCSYGPRVPNTGDTGAHKQCEDYILDEMKKSCDDAHAQVFSYYWKHGHHELKMANLIGTQNWKDAKVRVVLLAHWDSRPEADQDPNPANHNTPILGADDGASGVAVLLELARVMKGRVPKGLGVMYFMTDGEDVGPDSAEMYLGVKEFMRDLQAPRPNYGILLDMIGNKGVRVPMEPGSLVGQSGLVEMAFYKHAKEIGLGDTFPDVNGPEIEDDHLVLIHGGIPTIDLIDFNYVPWHTLQDTVDKCSPDSLKQIGTALESWLLQDPPFALPK
ncbi:MAG TPA: M28 family peptidase [Fimbriimonadaceae bacterium]|nr:M28 family peptidase [Fimbriimonadaceae bacterium]